MRLSYNRGRCRRVFLAFCCSLFVVIIATAFRSQAALQFKRPAPPAPPAPPTAAAAISNNTYFVNFPASRSLHVAWEVPLAIVHDNPILADGYVYVLTDQGVFEARDRTTGRVRWKIGLLDYVGSSRRRFPLVRRRIAPGPSPLVVGNSLFVSCSDGTQSALLCLDAKRRKVVWVYRSQPAEKDIHSLRGPVRGGLVATADRLIVETGLGLTALRQSDGTEIWNEPLDPSVQGVIFYPLGRPVVRNGVLLVGADMGTAYGFDVRTGRMKWRFATSGRHAVTAGNVERVISTPTLCPPLLLGNTFYTADGLGNVYALDASTGDLLWRQRVGVAWQFASRGDDLFVVTTKGFYELSPTSGKTLHATTMEGGVYSCLVSPTSALVAGNPYKSPGWQLLDLATWKPLGEDADYGVRNGVSADRDGIVMVGSARPVGGGAITLKSTSTLRCYVPDTVVGSKANRSQKSEKGGQ